MRLAERYLLIIETGHLEPRKVCDGHKTVISKEEAKGFGTINLLQRGWEERLSSERRIAFINSCVYSFSSTAPRQALLESQIYDSAQTDQSKELCYEYQLSLDMDSR